MEKERYQTDLVVKDAGYYEWAICCREPMKLAAVPRSEYCLLPCNCHLHIENVVDFDLGLDLETHLNHCSEHRIVLVVVEHVAVEPVAVAAVVGEPELVGPVNAESRAAASVLQ